MHLRHHPSLSVVKQLAAHLRPVPSTRTRRGFHFVVVIALHCKAQNPPYKFGHFPQNTPKPKHHNHLALAYLPQPRAMLGCRMPLLNRSPGCVPWFRCPVWRHVYPLCCPPLLIRRVSMSPIAEPPLSQRGDGGVRGLVEGGSAGSCPERGLEGGSGPIGPPLGPRGGLQIGRSVR
jgi:hypothetical protein